MSCQCGAVFSSLEALRRHRERPWYIYGLAEPEGRPDAGLIRYVGKTQVTPERRLRGHLKGTIKEDTHPGRWLHKLLMDGLIPTMTVLETGAGHGVNDAERWYIDWWAYSGQLTNHRAGGDGGRLLEGPAGDVTRAKMSSAMRASPAIQAQMAKMNSDLSMKQRRVQSMRRTMSHPAWRESWLRSIRRAKSNPAFREIMRNSAAVQEHLKRINANPEVQRKRIEATIAANKRRAKSQPQGATP